MKRFFYRAIISLARRKSLSKQNVMSFVGEHPRLITLLAGLGITFTFASVGKFFLSEAFAISSSIDVFNSASAGVEHMTKFSVGSVPVESNTIPNLTCTACAEEAMPEPFPEDKFPFDKFPADKFPKNVG